jgi:hypothetical protein
MKNSHFQAPRTMEDCQFAFNADPIEAYHVEQGWHVGLWFSAGCFALAVLVLVAVSLEWI